MASERARKTARRPAAVFLVILLVTFVYLALTLLKFSPVEAAAALTPSTIRSAYDVNVVLQSGYTGRGVTVAVVNKGIDSTFYSDVKAFNAMYDLPDAVISVVRPYGFAGTDQELAAGETTFDVELVHVMAPAARILLVLVGKNSVLDGLTYVIDNNAADIAILCASWAYWGEGARELVQSYNLKYSESVEKRITLIVPSNVWGSNNTVRWGTVVGDFWTTHLPDSYLMPQYSPYVTAVGGTVLSVSSGSYVSETGWDRSGGGPSNLFAQPTWQTGPGVPSNGFRNIPDIALNAACETSYAFYWNGTSATFCGTSGSAATFAGIIADIVQAAGGRLGFLNPALYSIASSDPSVFHDVTSGCSLVKVGSNVREGYCASKGWDFVTGWGSPDAARLTRWLAPNATIITEVPSEKPEAKIEPGPAAVAAGAFVSATVASSQVAGEAGQFAWKKMLEALQGKRAEADFEVEKETRRKIRKSRKRELGSLVAAILVVASALAYAYAEPRGLLPNVTETIQNISATPRLLFDATVASSTVLLLCYLVRLGVANRLKATVEYKLWIVGILMLFVSALFKSPFGAPGEVRTEAASHRVKAEIALSVILASLATSGFFYLLLKMGFRTEMGVYYGLTLAVASAVPVKPLAGYSIRLYDKKLSGTILITCLYLFFVHLFEGSDTFGQMWFFLTILAAILLVAVAAVLVSSTMSLRRPKAAMPSLAPVRAPGARVVAVPDSKALGPTTPAQERVLPTGVKYCIQCGELIPGVAVYCPRCASKQEQ